MTKKKTWLTVRDKIKNSNSLSSSFIRGQRYGIVNRYLRPIQFYILHKRLKEGFLLHDGTLVQQVP